MPKLSPSQRWVLLFCFWMLLLTGSLARFVGSPGIVQAVRLQELLTAKQTELARLQADLRKLRNESEQLESNRWSQVREIRRVLGYAAQDELIFDFTNQKN